MNIYETPLKDGLRDIIAGAIRENGPQTDLEALFDGVTVRAAAVHNAD
ncbi:MAG: hypothetical protein WD407_12185 [Rhodospirillales bacterium]